MEFHPSREDVTRAKDCAERRGQHGRPAEDSVDDRAMPFDIHRRHLVETEGGLGRDDRAQIAKGDELDIVAHGRESAGRAEALDVDRVGGRWVGRLAWRTNDPESAARPGRADPAGAGAGIATGLSVLVRRNAIRLMRSFSLEMPGKLILVPVM